MSTTPRAARRWKVLAISCVLSVVCSYFGWVLYRSARAYADLEHGAGWIGHVFEADPDLGFRLAANARGSEKLPAGPDVAVWTDEDGFRVPADPARRAGSARPRILALGCSFTFGAGCEAEETFPELVAARLHGTVRNAGVPSYGSAQMLVLARRHVPALRPDFVLFQHSPWLPERSRRRDASSFLDSLQTACFENTPEGIELRGPAFRPIVFDLPLDEYLRSPRGVADFLGFECRVGIPLLVHDDFARALVRLREGPLEPPSVAEETAYVHEEVARLCAESGSKLVVVLVGKSSRPVALDATGPHRPWLVVDAVAALSAQLPPDAGDAGPDAYLARYGRWGGDPPRLVDAHPNPLAHSIIAEAIVAAIEARSAEASR